VLQAIIILALFFPPSFFHKRKAPENDEIARKNITLLMPPGPLDIPAPARPPQPRIQVNPNVIRKVAPPALPAPVPQPEQPKRRRGICRARPLRKTMPLSLHLSKKRKSPRTCL